VLEDYRRPINADEAVTELAESDRSRSPQLAIALASHWASGNLLAPPHPTSDGESRALFAGVRHHDRLRQGDRWRHRDHKGETGRARACAHHIRAFAGLKVSAFKSRNHNVAFAAFSSPPRIPAESKKFS
jgi:hypothetical protein